MVFMVSMAYPLPKMVEAVDVGMGSRTALTCGE